MILIDSNVPMYLVGAAHPHKHDAVQVLERLVSERVRLVTDAEVYQEILHRYGALQRRDMIQPAFDVLDALVDEVLPITLSDVRGAKEITLARPRLSARDCLHIAVMHRHRVGRILSFDTGFDDVPGVERVHAS